MVSQQLKRAWDKAVKGADQRLWVYGTLGNPAGVVAVPGRADYVYVTLGNKSVTWARNEAGVPLTAGLAVRMRVENNTHVIYGRSTSGELAAPTETPASGVLPHTHDIGAAIDAATEATTFANVDKFALVVGGALQWLSGANLKAALKTYFDTLYVILAGKAGGQHLRGGTGSGDDLTLESTSHATKGHVAIQPSGGNVVIGDSAAPSETLKVVTASGHNVILSQGSFSGRFRLAATGATSGARNFEFTSRDGSLQISALNDDWTLYLKQFLLVALPNGNIGFGTDSQFGSGQQVIAIANRTVAPTTNPTNAYVLYAEGGALKGRGASGTITTLGVAHPHCPVCGADYVAEFENKKYGYFVMCLRCLAEELGERPWINWQSKPNSDDTLIS